MVIEGRIWNDGAWWLAESAIVDVRTQGRTRAGAVAMLADAIESLASQDGFKVSVRDVGDETVSIEANDPAALAAFVQRRQREVK